MFRKSIFYLSSFLGYCGHIDFFINNGLGERPNDAYNWPGAVQYFGLIQCTLISILLYLSHLLQNKTLYLPQILGQIQCTPRSGAV